MPSSDVLRRVISGLGGLLLVAVLAVTLAAPVHAAQAQAAQAGPKTVDHSAWDALLAAHVQGGLVDYTAFEADKPKLEAYLDSLAMVDPESLSRDEQFAFYANAYNAWTVKLILDNYRERDGSRLESIKDIGSLFTSPWELEIVHLRQGTVSLDFIEHQVLRPRFKDPRVHVAINCASLGCPRLPDYAFTGAGLQEQLDRQARAFVNNPYYVRVDGDVLRVSRIFDWFGEDFDTGQGKEPGVVAFILRYAEPELAARIRALPGQPAPRLSYLRYDWSLNDTRSAS